MPKNKILLVDGLEINLHFKKIKRIYLKVKPDGQILLSAPMRTPSRYLRDFVRQRRDWIEASQIKIRNQSAPSPGENETLVFGQLVPRKIADAELQKQLENKIAHHFTRYWPYFEKRGCLNIQIKYRKMSATWGICRPTQGTITFNKRLIHQPEAFIEYVVLHELCHLLICNHSKEFYTLVAGLMPDYKEKMKTRLIHL